MKIFKLNFFSLLALLILSGDVRSQSCTDCFCGTEGNYSAGEDARISGSIQSSGGG